MPAAYTETEGNRLSKSLDRHEQRNRYSPWPWIMQWRSVQRGLLLFKVNLSEEGWVWGFNSLFRLVNDRGRKSFDWYAEWPKFPWYFFWLRACFGQKGPRFPIILSLFWSKWPKFGLSRLKEAHSWKKYNGRYNSFSKNFKFVLNGLLASAERKRGLLVIHSLH